MLFIRRCLLLFHYRLLLRVKGLVPELRLGRRVLLLEEILISSHYLAYYFVFGLGEIIENIYCMHLDGLKKGLCHYVLSHLCLMMIKRIRGL
jgi:hypothetical protein